MRFLAILFLSFIMQSLTAQTSYFQQEVNYTISATLDDVAHSVEGQISMEYTNNSPNVLHEVWMHLWPNAYKNNKSAFCKQKLASANTEYYFSKESERGGFDKLDFSVNGQKIEWKIDKKNPDIARLILPEPLLSGAKITIATPYFLKIPASFSRLGHVDQSYQMTQWYPKPAVFDKDGWHAMPYLDMGEFYSEFGAFDVTLNVPQNYVVGATGQLQTESEWRFLEEKMQETKEKLEGTIDEADTAFPPSASERKTIRYKAEKVHDFAWFADKRFYVMKDTAILASGKKVDCWAMFTNFECEIWRKGAFYTKRAVEHYSELVGDYPWPQATAVQSALSAGGGMEYPMITVIGPSHSAKALDEVITHEVGHNWFYGILASNERDHPFMDEGMNTYYENRYMKKYYDGNNYAIKNTGWKRFIGHSSIEQLAWESLNSIGYNQAPDAPSNSYTEVEYGMQVYAKTGMIMHWLEESIGTQRMDEIMQDYYKNWAFKHPSPADFKAELESHALNADWLMEQLQTRKSADYFIKNVKRGEKTYTLTIGNKGSSSGPIHIVAYRDDVVVGSKWFENNATQDVQVLFPLEEKADYFTLDAFEHGLDANRNNNSTKSKEVRISPLAIVRHPDKTSVIATPWLGWNNYDKTMVGGVFMNPIFPMQKVQYVVAPAYATGSRQLVGLADVRFRLFPNEGPLKRFTLGITGKTFHEKYAAQAGDAVNPITGAAFNRADLYRRFYRVVPFVRFDFRTAEKTFRHRVHYRALFIGQETAAFDDSTRVFIGETNTKSLIHELRYEAEGRNLPNPWSAVASLEGQAYDDAFGRPSEYVKLGLEYKQDFFYATKRKVSTRIFAGYFLKNSKRNAGNVASNLARASFSLNPQGFNDYKYDEVFLGRNQADGILGRQVSQTDGGFKSAFGSPFANVIGNSNNYIFAINLMADLPKRLPLGIPLKPYFDFGYFDDASTLGEGRSTKDQIMYSGGFALSLLRGGLEVYFPLVNSKNLKDRYCEASGGSNESALFCGGNYAKWISFRINIERTDIVDVVDYNLR